MNKSLNVFLSVLLCAVLCLGVLTSLYTTDDSASQYSQTEYTSSVPTGTGVPTVSLGVGVSGNDLAVPMSSRPSRGSVRHPSSHRLVTSLPNSLIASSPNSHITSSPNSLITYTSSSQTMKSFGGGSNAAGVSMPGGVVSTNNLTTSSPNNLLALSPNNLITSSPTNLLAFSPNNLITSSPNTLLASSTGARGIGGRHNAPGNAGYNNWLNWMYGYGWEYGTENGNEYTYDNAQTEEAYLAWFNATYGCDPEDYHGSTPALTYEQWLQMFLQNDGRHQKGDNWYIFTPIGDTLPLLILALLYLLSVIVVKYLRKSLSLNSVFKKNNN